MQKHFPLQPLVNLAHQKNDAATRKLGRLNQEQRAAQNKLEALLQYLDDYRTRFQNAVRGGMDHADLRNFQEFINRLEDAIAQQRAVIAKADQSVRAGMDELHHTRKTMKSFDTLSQRHTAAENKLAEKVEQRLQDEHTGRFFARGKINEDET